MEVKIPTTMPEIIVFAIVYGGGVGGRRDSMNSNYIDFLNLFRKNLILNFGGPELCIFLGLPSHPSPHGPWFPRVDLEWHL